ncbi:hypothetical protein K6W62_14290 [Burkholderia multivorans]|jgi:hypothetical protein|nr:hypothetical protein [Burkholderia multivorans]
MSPLVRNLVGCRPHGIILGMHMSREHGDGLVRSQRYSDLDGNAGISDVGGRAMADAMRPDAISDFRHSN